mgnify:FL=1
MKKIAIAAIMTMAILHGCSSNNGNRSDTTVQVEIDVDVYTVNCASFCPDIQNIPTDSMPVISERVTANLIENYGDSITQISFKFSDADKWASITRENTGRQLAIAVNGKITNAPMVNMAIESGNCSVSVSPEMFKKIQNGQSLF